MNRIKTLSLPLISALLGSAALPAGAQVALQLSSQKAYRQDKDSVNFRGGMFNIRMDDGHITSTHRVCDDPNYYPPGTYIGVCSPGTGGFLSSGNINGATIQRPYIVVAELTPAIVVEPQSAKRIFLNAAPASKLPRPSGGFTDDSASVYFNLNTTSIREYDITGYYLDRGYDSNQREKFESEIVPGAYHYSFPRLNYPNLPAPITAVIYPMPEGLAVLNKQETGFRFTNVNTNRWNKEGFLELSYLRPNEIEWQGLSSSVVFAAVDSLYISLRQMRNPESPQGSDVIRGTAMFPAFTNGGDPRVLLANPYVTTFTTPPIFPSGTSGILELELQRAFQTGGVTYDFSNRKFQIPVSVVDRFSEYADINLSGNKKAPLLADTDRDGFNNLTEWILDSNAGENGSRPIPPTPAPYQAVDIIGGPSRFGSYFGFNVNVKRGTIPKVVYTLQRSRDGGKTWQRFRSDPTDVEDPFADINFLGWSVETVTTTTRGIVSTQIQVRSRVPNPDLAATIPTIQPPGSLGDLYRVKVTLRKKR